VRFTWQFEDQTEPRYWMTLRSAIVPKFIMRVVVKASSRAAWIGPWQESEPMGR
jgi:hypothetical protein